MIRPRTQMRSARRRREMEDDRGMVSQSYVFFIQLTEQFSDFVDDEI
jgi:hypothetical protein